MAGLLNVASLVLGLIAWSLPVVSLLRTTNHWAALSIMSLTACSVSLFCQIAYNYHLVQIADWAALMDTMGAVVTAAMILLIVTLLLNVSTLIVYSRKTAKY